jgi:PhoPQ-activated pathogenicity-related protein
MVTFLDHAISRYRGRGFARKASLAGVVLATALGLWGTADAARETRSVPRAQASPPAAVDRSPATPLDLYVRAPDPVYGYRPVSEIEVPGCRAYVLELTSGEWRSPDEVDHPLWKHWMTVYVPASVEYRTALISIGGGRSTDPPPKKAHADLARIAAATRSIVVHLQQVPNQPLRSPARGAAA